MNKRFSNYITQAVCIIIILASATAVLGQSSTKVILESGPSEEYIRMVESSTERILDEINRYYEYGEFSLPGEPASRLLKALITANPVRSERDTLRSYMIELSNGNYEIRKIFLQVGEQSHEYQELSAVFDTDGKFVDARLAESTHNFERTLNRAIEADEEDYERVSEFVVNFADAFADKDLELIDRHLGDESLIVTGSQAGPDDEVRYLRLNKDEYLQRLQENTFAPNPDVDVLFEDIEVYRNPGERDIFTVNIFQHWNTTYYSDEGYLVLVADLREADNPKVLVRSWQPGPFEVARYSEIDPDPEPLGLGLTEVRRYLPGDTLTISERVQDNEGYVTIIVESDDPELLNANKLKEWIDEDILEITGVELDMAGIMEESDSEIRIPFASDKKDTLRHVQSGIEIFDTAFLESYSGRHVLVLQRENVFTLKVTSKEEEEEEMQATPPGDLILTTNIDSTYLHITSTDGYLSDTLLTDDILMKPFDAGSYEAQLKKEGYGPRQVSFDIVSGELTSIHVDMGPVEVTPSFYSRNRIWIWTAAAVTTLATTAVILTGSGSGGGGTSSAGLPGPPGRP